MERIGALIDKLYQQKQQNCNPAQLLLTVQLLQSELLKFQQRNGTLGTAKVAVTLPTNANYFEEVITPGGVEVLQQTKKVQEIEDPTPPVQQTTVNKNPEPTMPSSPQTKQYSLQKPIITQHPEETAPPPYVPQEQQASNLAFDAMTEVPTLTQHDTKKELHEVIGENKESLNDRLKQEKTEVVHVLKDLPIKDLRKAIGINDRFSFVRELFRGDDALYERSIKTINSFHILSEAEYWMNRELKVKLGWNDNKEVVQHFYQLVRRRFS